MSNLRDDYRCIRTVKSFVFERFGEVELDVSVFPVMVVDFDGA